MRWLAVLAFLIIRMAPAFADTPVSDTTFYKAYLDVPMVKAASLSRQMNAEIAAFLKDAGNSIDIRAAVINALSWESGDKADKYAKLAYGKFWHELTQASLQGDELFCLGYLMLMDSYHSRLPAVDFLRAAAKKRPGSRTISLVLAIARAQPIAFEGQIDERGGDVWLYTREVLDERSLKDDMRSEAVKIIKNYMSMYRNDAMSEHVGVRGFKSDRRRLYNLSDGAMILRDAPSAGGKPLEKIPFGTELKPLGRGGQKGEVIGGYRGFWLKVRYRGKTGWVFDGLLSSLNPPKAGERLDRYFGRVAKIVKRQKRDESMEMTTQNTEEWRYSNGAILSHTISSGEGVSDDYWKLRYTFVDCGEAFLFYRQVMPVLLGIDITKEREEVPVRGGGVLSCEISGPDGGYTTLHFGIEPYKLGKNGASKETNTEGDGSQERTRREIYIRMALDEEANKNFIEIQDGISSE